MLATIFAYCAMGAAAVAAGYTVDLIIEVRSQNLWLRHIRDDQAAFRAEILHHVTERPRSGQRVDQEARLAELRGRLRGN